jgi:hypothetical protein
VARGGKPRRRPISQRRLNEEFNFRPGLITAVAEADTLPGSPRTTFRSIECWKPFGGFVSAMFSSPSLQARISRQVHLERANSPPPKALCNGRPLYNRQHTDARSDDLRTREHRSVPPRSFLASRLRTDQQLLIWTSNEKRVAYPKRGNRDYLTGRKQLALNRVAPKANREQARRYRFSVWRKVTIDLRRYIAGYGSSSSTRVLRKYGTTRDRASILR